MCWKSVFAMTSAFSWQNSMSLYPSSFCTPRPNLPVTPGVSWRRQWQPTPALLPGKSHGRRSLVGYSPWGCEEADRTERVHFHFSLLCTGEGNGSPLQYSCMENPRDESLVGCCLWGRTESDTTEAAQQQQQEKGQTIHWNRLKQEHLIMSTYTFSPTPSNANLGNSISLRWQIGKEERRIHL